MQKLLFLILGFLGIVFLIEVGFLVWQKYTPVPITVVPTLAPSPPTLPLSSLNKPGIRFVKLSDEYTKQGFIGWADGDFFYGAVKGYVSPILPFSFIGIVKKVEKNKVEVESTQNDGKKITVKIQLSDNAKVVERKTNTSVKLQTGEKIRILRLHHKVKNGEYYIIDNIEILS